MNLIETKNDLFSVPQGYYLAHCISSDFSLGAGVAKKIDEIFNMREKLNKQGHTFKGRVGIALCIDNVFNLVIKKVKYDSAQYSDLEDAIYDMKYQMEEKYISKLAIPHIGCGKEGFEWSIVRNILTDVFDDMNVEILVCSL